jgi:hypothetical protein
VIGAGGGAGGLAGGLAGGDTVVGAGRVASGTGAVGGGELAGAADKPVVKLRPHASQNWPALGAPHCGHVSADGAEGTRVTEGAGLAEGTAGAPEMRMPHVSQ